MDLKFWRYKVTGFLGREEAVGVRRRRTRKRSFLAVEGEKAHRIICSGSLVLYMITNKSVNDDDITVENLRGK